MNSKIHKLVETAIRLNFEVNPIFYDLNEDQLAKIYNGCGPAFFPKWLRDAITEYYSFFEAGFLEHDVSFEISDKTKAEFKAANKRLLINGKKLVASSYSWLKNPIMKYRRYRQAYFLYAMCKRFGWSAWTA